MSFGFAFAAEGAHVLGQLVAERPEHFFLEEHRRVLARVALVHALHEGCLARSLHNVQTPRAAAQFWVEHRGYQLGKLESEHIEGKPDDALPNRASLAANRSWRDQGVEVEAGGVHTSGGSPGGVHAISDLEQRWSSQCGFAAAGSAGRDGWQVVREEWPVHIGGAAGATRRHKAPPACAELDSHHAAAAALTVMVAAGRTEGGDIGGDIGSTSVASADSVEGGKSASVLGTPRCTHTLVECRPI